MWPVNDNKQKQMPLTTKKTKNRNQLKWDKMGLKKKIKLEK